jgi:TonB-dependent receptor-like protein
LRWCRGRITYRLISSLSVYGGCSESNRAPTPAELACADPARPCLLENFFVADPPLKQAVAHTVEAGVRSEINVVSEPATWSSAAKFQWSLGLFRTLSTDDILSVVLSGLHSEEQITMKPSSPSSHKANQPTYQTRYPSRERDSRARE